MGSCFYGAKNAFSISKKDVIMEGSSDGIMVRWRRAWSAFSDQVYFLFISKEQTHYHIGPKELGAERERVDWDQWTEI